MSCRRRPRIAITTRRVKPRRISGRADPAVIGACGSACVAVVVGWHIVLFVDRLGGAFGQAGSAVDAIVGVDEELEVGEAGGA
jgi:hypothetical protein